MFTGIIQAVGEVKAYDASSFVLTISCPLFLEKKPPLGASIAIDGVCLTVSHLYEQKSVLGFTLGQETRNISLLAKKIPNDLVNVEFALCVGQPLDGHMVQGHVDGIAEITKIETTQGSRTLSIRFPKALSPFIVTKGSIALNGVSLTVNDMAGDDFSIGLVPYTLEHTNFMGKELGDKLHIETDILGRYLYKQTSSSKIRDAKDL